MMLSNECWLGMHDFCEAHEHCDCMCHDVWSVSDNEQLSIWAKGSEP